MLVVVERLVDKVSGTHYQRSDLCCRDGADTTLDSLFGMATARLCPTCCHVGAKSPPDVKAPKGDVQAS